MPAATRITTVSSAAVVTFTGPEAETLIARVTKARSALSEGVIVQNWSPGAVRFLVREWRSFSAGIA